VIYPDTYLQCCGSGSHTALLFSDGIFKQSLGARNQVGIGLSYQPARRHSLVEFVPWNRFLGPFKLKIRTQNTLEIPPFQGPSYWVFPLSTRDFFTAQCEHCYSVSVFPPPTPSPFHRRVVYTFSLVHRSGRVAATSGASSRCSSLASLAPTSPPAAAPGISCGIL
jgi:hypothetical protein